MSYNHTVGAVPSRIRDEKTSQPRPEFLTYRTPMPLIMNRDDWHYSEAPLVDVKEVQLCVDDGHCIGLCLHYKDFSMAVGQFREDKDTSQIYHGPRFIQLVRIGSEHKFNINLLGDEKVMPNESEFLAMAGCIVWWYGKGVPIRDYVAIVRSYSTLQPFLRSIARSTVIFPSLFRFSFW